MQNFVWTRKYILTVQYTGFGHTTRIFAQLLLGLWLRRSYALEVWGFWICLWLKQELLFCTVPLSVIFSIFPIPAHWNGSCRFASLTGVPIFSCRSSIGFWPNALLVVRKLENQATTIMDSLWSLLLVSVPVWLFPVGGSWEWNEPACPLLQSHNVRTGRNRRLFHFCYQYKSLHEKQLLGQRPGFANRSPCSLVSLPPLICFIALSSYVGLLLSLM